MYSWMFLLIGVHVFRDIPIGLAVLYISCLLLTDSTMSYGPAIIVEREQIEQVQVYAILAYGTRAGPGVSTTRSKKSSISV